MSHSTLHASWGDAREQLQEECYATLQHICLRLAGSPALAQLAQSEQRGIPASRRREQRNQSLLVQSAVWRQILTCAC